MKRKRIFSAPITRNFVICTQQFYSEQIRLCKLKVMGLIFYSREGVDLKKQHAKCKKGTIVYKVKNIRKMRKS